MRQPNNIFQNTGAVLIGTLIRMSSSFILTILVARKLGSTGMGEFSLLISLFYVFQTVASLGIQPLVIREVAKDHNTAVSFLVNTGILGLASSVIMGALLFGFVHIAGYSETIRIGARYIGTALLFATLSTLFQGIFIAYERAEFTLYATAAESVFKLGAGIFILNRGYGIIELSAVFALSSFVGVLINVFLQSVFFEKIRFVPDWNRCRWIIRKAPTFAGISVFNALLSHAVLIMLSMMSEMDTVGYYGAAMRLVGVFRLVLQSYKSALQPVSAKLVVKSLEKLKQFGISSIRYILVLILPLCVGTTLLSNRIVVLFFSDAFIHSGPILRIVIWVLVPYSMGMVFSNILIASDHQRVNLHVNAASMIVRVLLALMFIPALGGMGAGLAILCSRMVFFAMQLQFINRTLFRFHLSKEMWKTLSAALVMGICVFLLSEMKLIPLVLIGAACFFFMLVLTGGFRLSELRQFMFSSASVPVESS